MNSTRWTKECIPDLTGKTLIVTGGNSGLGFESVKAFVHKGAKVVLACRHLWKGEAAKSEILKENPSGDIIVRQIDLGSLASIAHFARQIQEEFPHIDVLLNNAGIMATPNITTTDGFEMQFGVNHLGHFALTGHLQLTRAVPTHDWPIISRPTPGWYVYPKWLAVLCSRPLKALYPKFVRR